MAASYPGFSTFASKGAGEEISGVNTLNSAMLYGLMGAGASSQARIMEAGERARARIYAAERGAKAANTARAWGLGGDLVEAAGSLGAGAIKGAKAGSASNQAFYDKATSYGQEAWRPDTDWASFWRA